TLEPEDSLIMGDEELSNIHEKESDEFIKSSVEDLVPSQEKSVTFSNPLFDSNDDFTSSYDESLSDEDVPEDNMKIYSNPLFEFDEEYISITPIFNSNEDEFFTPGDDIEFLLHRDLFTQMISVVSILKGFTDKPPLEDNDDLFDLKSKTNEWKKILYDDPIDDLIFDPGGDVDEIDAFLDIDIPTNIKAGFYDSEGDVLYLESLLSNDTT
ncbi:hypothetical protein Tco_1158315, partial [Tanacetum coccineum]